MVSFLIFLLSITDRKQEFNDSFTQHDLCFFLLLYVPQTSYSHNVHEYTEVYEICLIQFNIY